MSSSEESKKESQHRPCPKCGAARVHRSRTRTIPERLMRLLNWRMYRCHECQFRFFRLGASVLSPGDAHKMGRRILMWVVAALGVLGCAFIVRMLILGMADPGPSG